MHKFVWPRIILKSLDHLVRAKEPTGLGLGWAALVLAPLRQPKESRAGANGEKVNVARVVEMEVVTSERGTMARVMRMD